MTTEDIRSCDREQIHLYQSIQSHGCLIAFSWPDRRIQVASENTPDFLKIPLQEILGSKLDYILEPTLLEKIAKVIESYPWKTAGRHLHVRPKSLQKSFDTYLFKSDELFVLELEDLPEFRQDSVISETETEQVLRDYMLSCKTQTNLRDLSHLVCHTFRRITGLDRVMMYRFLPPSWHGEVIAEDRVAHAHSYLNHRFPASDIPTPARNLYLRNQVRLISDLNLPVSPLHPPLNPLSKAPLDLSDSRLRSVAPIHLEYLKNMNVGASFSVAVTHDRQLWGLITCHHLSPITLTQSQRTACEIIAHAYSIQAPLIEESLSQSERIDFETKIKKVLENLLPSRDPLGDFFKQHRTISESFFATGIALVGRKMEDFAGMTPLRADMENLANVLRNKMKQEGKNLLAIESLAEIDPSFSIFKDYSSGVLATMLPDISESILMIFRPEVLRIITWGGNPEKQLQKREFSGTINPRVSFESWQQKVTNTSEPWKKFEIDGILFLRDFIFEGLVKKERLIRELAERGN